jgi:hypothetical protein
LFFSTILIKALHFQGFSYLFHMVFDTMFTS